MVPTGKKLLNFLSDILSKFVLELFVKEHVELNIRQYSILVKLQDFAKVLPVFVVTNALVEVIQGFELMLVDGFRIWVLQVHLVDERHLELAQ